MTPQDVPGPLGLDWIERRLRALAEASTPQVPRAAGEVEERFALREAA
jgi:hypothetical protein